MDKQNSKQTLIEEGTEFRGTLKSTCRVVVLGVFEGEIEAPELNVTQTGSVQGVVKVERLRSEGSVAGSIDADEVYLSGVVRSSTRIRAAKLEMRLTQEDGKLELAFGEDGGVSGAADQQTAGSPASSGSKTPGSKSGGGTAAASSSAQDSETRSANGSSTADGA